MTHFLIQDSLLVLGLTAVLCLFLALKREMQKGSRRIDALLRRLHELEAREPEPVFVPSAPCSGMNLNKRVQATRMLRRGEDASHISAALGLPQKEVELLVRVQAMAAGQSSA
jgi:hypothetical protein